MFKKTFLLLIVGSFIGSVAPVQAGVSRTTKNEIFITSCKALGVMLVMGGVYAAVPSLYQLSENWYDYRWFVKTVYTVGVTVGIGTLLCGSALIYIAEVD